LSYVTKKILAPNEHVVYRAKFPWIYTFNSILILILLGWILIGIYLFLARQIRRWTTEIVVTNHRMIVKTGWISKNVRELNLATIEEINVKQSFWGGLLNYGSVDVRGTGEGNLELPAVDNPKALNVAITSARIAAQGQGQSQRLGR
jgi:uncharacterized membrane protein YdbT with pleckstrin-like domain